MITDTVQRKSCYNYATPWHTHCRYGRIFLGASDEVKKQVLKHVINCFSMLTTRAFIFKQGRLWVRSAGRSDGFQFYRKARDHFKTAVKNIID